MESEKFVLECVRLSVNLLLDKEITETMNIRHVNQNPIIKKVVSQCTFTLVEEEVGRHKPMKRLPCEPDRAKPRHNSLGASAHYCVERCVELALLIGGRSGRLGPPSRRAFFRP